MRVLAGILIAAVSLSADARSPKQVSLFRAVHPCPVTGTVRGSCPGYVVDHVVPLCAGGLDHPSNMQWQTVADAKIKDREERRLCRAGHETARAER